MKMLTGNHSENFAKDTVYRFLNSSLINWRCFTALLSDKVDISSITKLTDEKRAQTKATTVMLDMIDMLRKL